MKRAMIFMDAGNMYHDWQTTAPMGKKMDLEKLIQTILSKFENVELRRTYFFMTRTGDAAQDAFIDRLSYIPYLDLKFGRLQNKPIDLSKFSITCDCGRPIQEKTVYTKVDKGTDVNLAVEMLMHAFRGSYDLAILVSRDADFVRVVQIVKDIGKNVELVLFEGAKEKARELLQIADNKIILSTEDCLASSQN